MKLLQHDNIGSHYRSAIYSQMDKELGCDFCFGDHWEDIKKMNYSVLHGKVMEIKNVGTPRLYLQVGLLKMLRSDYDTYIICAEIRNISSWFFLILRKFFFPHKRVYAWEHGLLGKEGCIKIQVYKFQHWLMTGAFVYNERSVKIMEEHGVPVNKLHCIYNSLDYDTQLSIRMALKPSLIYQNHFDNDFRNIIFIGRLTKVKRFDLLLNAVAELKTRGERINITFIGDGVERLRMEQIIKELDIKDQVWFYGACYDEQKNAELIYNADLCVSPGNIGLTAMHVLMFGCPAITNDDFNHQMPEFEAIKDGVTGAFFKAGDSGSLANTISRWFLCHSDRECVRKACCNEIDTKWNPHNQIRILKSVLSH